MVLDRQLASCSQYMLGMIDIHVIHVEYEILWYLMVPLIRLGRQGSLCAPCAGSQPLFHNIQFPRQEPQSVASPVPR